jgi:hypothetical protein
MKKRFVAPLLREEATLSQLTLRQGLSGSNDAIG